MYTKRGKYEIKDGKYKKNLRWETLISLLSCFSGGVFIGACFLDLIPDVDSIFQQVLFTTLKGLAIVSAKFFRFQMARGEFNVFLGSISAQISIFGVKY